MNVRHMIFAVAIGSATLVSLPAAAGVTTYSGVDAGVAISGTGTSLGVLATPSVMSFSDVLGLNSGTTVITTTDDWSFSVPTSVFGATITGDQISLSNFSVTGTLDTVALYSGTPKSGTLIGSIVSVGSSFSSGVVATVHSAGSYYLEVVASLQPAAAGSYSGTLVAASVPEPRTWAMLAAALGILAVGLRRRG